LRSLSVTAESPVFRFTPNRNFTYSRDWDLAMVNRGRVNNAGFVNDQPYSTDDPLPMVAVIGDSYIAALMVPHRDTLQGRLARALDGRMRVYSFAAPGAPLSQYLIWARHAVRDYGASALIFNVVGNDFDESLSAYERKPGFWQYAPVTNGELRLRLFEYRPGWRRDLVVASALGRYLIFNLQVQARWAELRSLSAGRLIQRRPIRTRPRYAGNTDAAADKTRMDDSMAAMDAFFRDLPEYSGLPPASIAFTVDGFRYPDDAEESAGSFFDLMRGALMAKARALGYDVIDLGPEFLGRFRRSGARFEFDRDGHWSAVGHEVAFEALAGSPFLARQVSKATANGQP
jgi:hypothetical protein